MIEGFNNQVGYYCLHAKIDGYNLRKIIMLVQPKHKFLFIILFGILWVKGASLLSMPYLTLYLSKNTSLSMVAIGLIVGCQPFALCFGGVVGGYLSDIFERKMILLYSVLLSSLVYFGFYFASEHFSGMILAISFAGLNLINGFSSALFSPVARAILTTIADNQEENVKYLHARYLAINLGATIGPLLGAYAGIVANNTAFLVTGISYLLYLGFLFLVSRQDAANNEYKHINIERQKFFDSLFLLIKNKAFLYLLLSLTIFNILYVQLTSNIGLIISQNITNGVVFFSLMLSLNAILVVVLQPILFVFTKHRSQNKVVLYGYIIMLSMMFFMLIFPLSKPVIIAFVVCLTLAEIMVFPPSSILVGNLVEEKYLGMAYGVIDMEYLGSAIGPVIGGFILQKLSLGWYWGSLFILCLACIVIYTRCLKKYP